MTATRETRVTRRARPTGYCLRCYTPLQDTSRPVEECASCGFLNTRQARRSRWTLEPALVRLEWTCKLAILALCLAAYIHFALSIAGTSKGLILAVPAVFGVLWATASKITHRMPYFRAGVFWSAIVLVLGLMPAIASLTGALLFRDSIEDGLSRLLLAVPFGVLSLGILVLARRLERWKRDHVAHGAANANAPSAN